MITTSNANNPLLHLHGTLDAAGASQGARLINLFLEPNPFTLRPELL
jgi:hypothetical protein